MWYDEIEIDDTEYEDITREDMLGSIRKRIASLHKDVTTPELHFLCSFNLQVVCAINNLVVARFHKKSLDDLSYGELNSVMDLMIDAELSYF